MYCACKYMVQHIHRTHTLPQAHNMYWCTEDVHTHTTYTHLPTKYMCVCVYIYMYVYVYTHHHTSQSQYMYTQHTHIDRHKRDFSGGPVVKSSCQCRRQGFNPWSGKIPHARELLSLCTTGTEPRHPRARVPQQEKSPQWEACAPH